MKKNERVRADAETPALFPILAATATLTRELERGVDVLKNFSKKDYAIGSSSNFGSDF